MASKHKSHGTRRLQDRKHEGGWGDVLAGGGLPVATLQGSGVFRVLEHIPLDKEGLLPDHFLFAGTLLKGLPHLIFTALQACALVPSSQGNIPQLNRDGLTHYIRFISILFISKEKVGNLVCVTQMIPEVVRDTLNCS